MHHYLFIIGNGACFNAAVMSSVDYCLAPCPVAVFITLYYFVNALGVSSLSRRIGYDNTLTIYIAIVITQIIFELTFFIYSFKTSGFTFRSNKECFLMVAFPRLVFKYHLFFITGYRHDAKIAVGQ